MSINRSEMARKSVLASSKWLNNVLLFGFILALIIAISKSIGEIQQITLLEIVEIPLKYSWLLFSIFTLAHAYTTFLFIKAVRKYWNLEGSMECSNLFEELTGTGGIFMRGLVPRLLEGGRIARMSNTDISSWMSHIGGILLFFAIVPYELKISLLTLTGLLITYINWIIGSQWAIALSELAIAKERAFYLSGRRESIFSVRQACRTEIESLLSIVILQLKSGETSRVIEELTNLKRCLTEEHNQKTPIEILLRNRKYLLGRDMRDT